MFTSFKINNLETIINYFVEEGNNKIKYKEAGEQVFSENNIFQTKLKSFLLESDKDKNLLDADALTKEWFPLQDFDIFISHSHKDINQINIFVGILKEVFGLNAFIDSDIWKFSDDLLKTIDDCYAYNEKNKTYSYEIRNITTSNVHLMLANSLYNMIDQTECFIFIETDNSIIDIKNQKEDSEATYSPWIFSELNFISKLRMSIPSRFKIKDLNNFQLREDSSQTEFVKLAYRTEKLTDLLLELNKNDFIFLNKIKDQKQKSEVLDALYQSKGILETNAN